MILAYQILVTLVCFGMLAIGLHNLVFIARLNRRAHGAALPDPAPMISVCIPARNEGANIAACVDSLASQRYPKVEILVLDDCSEDATAGLAREAAANHPGVSVRVLSGQPLPPGWIGKAWACHQLAEVAQGEYLLFTDADTIWHPDALTTGLKLAREARADLFSGFARLEARSFFEQMSVPMLTLGGTGLVSLWLISHPAMKDYAAASGAFLLFPRVSYDRIGGHRGVKAEIVEDIELARRVKRCGLRLCMTDGSGMLRCRMYRSLGEVWEGFTKNFGKCFPGLLAPLTVLVIICLFVGPWLSLLASPWLGWGWWAGTILPLLQVLVIYTMRAISDRRFGDFSWRGYLLLPLAGLFTGLIGLRSWSRGLLRQPTPWRNRHYELWHRDPTALRHHEKPDPQGEGIAGD